MRNTRIRIFLVVLLFSVSPCLRGGFSTAFATQTLTLDRALSLALERNRDIARAREYRRQVEGKYVEERAAALPQLSLNGSATSQKDRSQPSVFGGGLRIDSGIAEVGLSQALFSWGKLGAAIRAAKEGLKTADDQLRLYRQAALRDVSATFYDVLLARELERLAAQNRDQKVRHLDEARRRFDAGVATDYDVLAAQVAAENARPDVVRTQNQVRTMKDQLRFLLALEEDREPQGDLSSAKLPCPSYEEALVAALKNRPELADLRHRQGISAELVKIASTGDKPSIDLKGAYGWRSTDFGGMNGDGPAWNAGLYLTWPFFDGMKTRGRVAQAESDLAALRIDEAKLIDTISLQTRQGVNAVREAEEIVAALGGTVTQAEKLLAMAEKGYEYGVKIRLEVEDAELNLLQAQSNLAKAKRDYVVACTNLKWVTGTLGE
jgi:outer membrane protein TolC